MLWVPGYSPHSVSKVLTESRQYSCLGGQRVLVHKKGIVILYGCPKILPAH